MKILVTEEQKKRLVSDVLIEQNVGASEVSATTDKNRITHSFLEKSFGLPSGSTYENFYYVSDVYTILGQSKGERNTYLSVFKPLSDSKSYIDYVGVGNETLTNDGSKTFNFKMNTRVIASHNGLLAIARGMDRMKGSPSLLTITFGTKDTRESKSVRFDSNRAFNISPGFVGLQNHIALLALNDVSKSSLYGSKYSNTNLGLIEKMIDIYTKSFTTGTVGFMDDTRTDEIVKTLIPKGFITTLDFNLKPIINEVKGLKQLPDFENNDINEDKINKIDAISKKYTDELVNKLKKMYINNFKIYIENYLPNSREELFSSLSRVYLKNYSLTDAYKSVLKSKMYGSMYPNSKTTQNSQIYKSGN